MVIVKAKSIPVSTDIFSAGAGSEVSWGRVFHFNGFTDESIDGTISLARKPDHCYYEISGLSHHDSHSPVMHSVENALEYVTRVSKDIETLVGRPNEDPLELNELKEALTPVDTIVEFTVYKNTNGGKKLATKITSEKVKLEEVIDGESNGDHESMNALFEILPPSIKN